ncbi:efflux transporter outer membrane subunit [Xenophilus arseniciresistens]|uniref:Efflux transporter outer membrane subunit n=1 Tax=Xenophilus arseniciresistens TaxID=1283306 RepID=A0AAE3NA96_9BURK|nr:efflux transporter outer membrane subunit [Xenophilus arseniciresistens]MDA7417538.1 efflux transporter outer membrane subunit [Xenophilus arseniciresistens]
MTSRPAFFLWRRYALAALPLALSACGLTRPPAQIDTPVPPAWQTPLPDAAATLPHAGSQAALAQWWQGAGDPLLTELIEAAQAASPNLASAAARVSEARAARVQAGAALLPNLDGSLTASRGNSMSASGGLGGGVGSTGTSATGGAGSSLPAITTLQAGLQAGWEIDLFGGLRASRDAASARLDASQAQWHEARVSVAAETANGYFAERACSRQLAVAESDAASRRESARLTQLSADAGFTAPADAALARAGAADAGARLTQQRTQCALLRQSLVALTGLEAGALARRLDAAPVQLALPALHPVDSVPARVLAQRPDVFAAEQAVAAASAEVGSAQAQRYPRLTLGGNIGRLQLRSGEFRQTLDTWSVGPVSLTAPIFDGGTRRANAEAAQARYDEAASQYRAKVRQAVREVEEALLKLQDTDARAADADTAVAGYDAALRAAQTRYDSGLASQFELEDARRTLFAAQTARVALQRERAEAWVLLYRAVGGGWQREGQAVASTGAAAPSSPTSSSSPSTEPAQAPRR